MGEGERCEGIPGIKAKGLCFLPRCPDVNLSSVGFELFSGYWHPCAVARGRG
jgi:hypothetical protein